jgi:tRNA(Glu) U13 pseudouridine synthase TruD
VPDLTLAWLPEGEGRDCELRFSLRAGSFATVALRELMVPSSAGDAAVDAEEEHG